MRMHSPRRLLGDFEQPTLQPWSTRRIRRQVK